MIDVEVLSSKISEINADAVLTGAFEDTFSDISNICGDDEKFCKLVTPLIKEGEINGQLGTFSLLHSRGEITPKRVLVIGLGKKSELSLDRLRGMAAVSGRFLRDIKCNNIGIHIGFLPKNLSSEDTSMALIEGFILGQYRFIKYIKEAQQQQIQKFGIYLPSEVSFNSDNICDAIRTGSIIARATNFSRDLCNEPGNVLTPTRFSEIAKDLSSTYNLSVKVLNEKELKKTGLNMLLAVGRGSKEEARLIVIKYEGADKNAPMHGLLGKGVTFDSGGISLKIQSAMSHMHMDKTAGAVVLGVAIALSIMKTPINFVGVVPAVENMPDGNSYRPGDILTSFSGKTVEVTNTDAEGRLIMADSLTYMQKNLNISDLIDFATLTGGAQTALGTDIIPIFSNTREMITNFKIACHNSGEDCWEMPLYNNYRRYLTSKVANIRNHANSAPSLLMGALFLNEFIEDNTNWMHLDIGGHEFREEEFSYQPSGATALGMRSLIRYYINLAKK